MKAIYLFIVGIYTLYTGFSNLNNTHEPVKLGNKMTMSNSSFLTSTYNTGLFEIEAAKLAQQKSSNNDVKTFAEKMINDHTALNNDIKSIASKMNTTLPEKLSDPTLKANIKKLEGLSGNTFNKQYAEMNVNGHKQCLQMFEKVSTDNTYDSNIKQLAANTIPKLKEHLQLAENLQQKVGKAMSNVN